MDTLTMYFGNTERAGHVPKVANAVFIDPGLGGTGWAFFPKIERGGDEAVWPLDSGVFRAPKNERWQNQCHSLAASLAGLLRGKGASAAVLEMPELFAGSFVSQACASHHAKPGEPADLFKLVYLVGVFGAAAFQATGVLPLLVSPGAWKGQLPKDALARRIMAALPGASYKDHEWDAVGMGLSAQGRL